MGSLIFDELARLMAGFERFERDCPAEWSGCGEWDALRQSLRAVQDAIAEAWPPSADDRAKKEPLAVIGSANGIADGDTLLAEDGRAFVRSRGAWVCVQSPPDTAIPESQSAWLDGRALERVTMDGKEWVYVKGLGWREFEPGH